MHQVDQTHHFYRRENTTLMHGIIIQIIKADGNAVFNGQVRWPVMAWDVVIVAGK